MAVALAGGGAWVAQAGTNPSAQESKQSQPYGVSIIIQSSKDTNYCLEAPPDDGNARAAIVAQCAARDDQHWTFVHPSDGSLVIVDSVGDCVDYQGGIGTPINIIPCTFTSAERFHYTTLGQFKDSSGKNCLQEAQVAQDAELFFNKCSKTDQLQVFRLAH